jgi:CTP:molybdopterin cytidylyltransferase MocA
VTVAAVILAASAESALADVEGLPRVRRLADIAWSGGATPIVVVAPDPEGRVALALAGAPVTLAEPAPPEAGPVGQIARGFDLAVATVSETDAALVWPARMVWVGPETVTSLIEAHGPDHAAMLRPAFAGVAGWPLLLPIDQLAAFRSLGVDLMPDALVTALLDGGAPGVVLDMGDPGVTHDAATGRADLPAYEGPPGPSAGHTHEWGAVAAEQADDDPLDAPLTVPYDGDA